MKRKPRWPKKARRKNTIEGENSNNRTRMKRNFPISTCMRCGLEGHKSKGCNNGGVPPKPKKWKLMAISTVSMAIKYIKAENATPYPPHQLILVKRK